MTPQEWASNQFADVLREELFFFRYHMKMSREETMSLTVHDRKWMAQRYIQQREMETEYLEQAKRQAKAKR